MIHFYRLLLIAIISLPMSHLSAQYLESFSQDTGKYIQELDQLFGNLLSDKEEEVYENFTVIWDSLEHHNRAAIMQVSELMLQRDCRARPYFVSFLEILNSFIRNKKTELGFNEWISGYRIFLSDEKTLLKQIRNLQETTLSVLSENKLYESVSLEWRLGARNFHFSSKGGQLRIVTEGTNLTCHSAGDSIYITDVYGYINPVNTFFIGSHGKVYWKHVGFESDETFAVLDQYKIDLRSPGYSADSVLLTHGEIFSKPVLGRIEDKVSAYKNPEQAKFPKFFTYQSTYEINDLTEGINFRGGLSLQGANLAGTGTETDVARLEIHSKDTLRVRLKSNLFLFNNRTIRSNHSQVSIFIEQDSIYHPDLVFVYQIPEQEMRLTKSDVYTSQGPYANTYHNVDMNFDELYWKRDKPVMRLQPALGTSIGRAFFESNDFFNYKFYNSLQGMDFQNPLAMLWMYANDLKRKTFPVKSYAVYRGVAPYQIRHQLMNLSKMGFVYFDDEEDQVTLRDKLYDFIDASLQKNDYDVIRFISRTESREYNASLNLLNKDLIINGIPNIFLSDSQNVKLVPEDNQIIMKRNRDFQFSGSIDAGLFKFHGQNFFFEYDSFKINLQDIDSLELTAKAGKKDEYGNEMMTSIDNKVEQITGELLIDAPSNKSGLENYPKYPVFTSRENSFIYFDEKTIQDGVYNRNVFYFELFPFSIDSLDNFTRDALKLEGTFVSAGILPPLELEMSLRPDNSLGFYLQTPEEGLPVFDGKGIFYEDLEMSSKGLHGYGSLDYLTSTTWSDDFLFHPDSVLTTSRRFLEREEESPVSFPYVENSVAEIRWYPPKDVMNINRVEKTFTIFNDSIYFGGDLALTPAGLRGTGPLALKDARIESSAFKFLAQEIIADSAGVMLKASSAEEFAWITENVRIHIQLRVRQGEFHANKDFTTVSFPQNMYETRLDHMTWDMDNQEVEMQQKELLEENRVDIGIDTVMTNGPTYLSLHPQQDSLRFVAPLSIYNYAERDLNGRDVPFIQIGDAYVFPYNGNVSIEEKAKMDVLKKAKILANTESRYHLLREANIRIKSRNYYSGSATYDYEDEFGNIYPFRLEEVEMDTSIETRGRGSVTELDSFMLSPYMAYQGEIRMFADNELLTFAGGVKLTHDCPINKQWLKFETEINPDSIMIPVDPRMQNVNLNNIYAGTLIARDSTHIYPTFFSGRKDYFDRNITYADGYLYYNKTEEKYELASLAKLEDHAAAGNYLTLKTDSCHLYGEGIIDMNLNYGKVDLVTVGNVVHKTRSNRLNMHVMLGLNFFFNKEALKVFGHEIDSLPDLDPVDLTTTFYKKGMKNLVGTETAEKLETEMGLYGSYSEIPDTMSHTILFNDVRLSWNQDTRSYRYNGEVGIGLVGDVQVNKKVHAYMEFVEKGSGDIFDIYLKANDNVWYYLAFSPGGMQVLSSNKKFNQIVFELRANQRRVKSRAGEPSYIYSLSSNRRMQLFLERFLYYEEEQKLHNEQ